MKPSRLSNYASIQEKNRRGIQENLQPFKSLQIINLAL